MNKPLWVADIDVDASLASRLASDQFPQLCDKTFEPFGHGWDNAAFLVDDKIVFRFPRRRMFAGLIEREVAILPRIAPQLPTPISAPQFIGASTLDFPWVFAGYELIAGVTACSVQLSDANRYGLAAPLARFLRALHDVEPAPLVARGLPPDEMGRLDHEKRLRMTQERLPTLLEGDVREELERTVAWLEAHPVAPLEESGLRLVHGDLYARHVLVDANAHLTGVIDWGDVHLGDPAIDIAIAHLMLPADAHAVFREAYGSIDDRTWTAARYRAIYHSILELDYGMKEKDAGMRQIGTAALRFLNASIV